MEFEPVNPPGDGTKQLIRWRGETWGLLYCLDLAERTGWEVCNVAGDVLQVLPDEYAAKQRVRLAFMVKEAQELLDELDAAGPGPAT